MKRYNIDSYDWREEEDKNGEWVKYTEVTAELNERETMFTEKESECHRLKERNGKFKIWHAKALRHSAHSGDQVEKVYSDLRIVSKLLIGKDYIAATELLSEIVKGE